MDNTTNTQLNESVNITISKIDAEIKRLEKLKADIQSECPHEESYTKFNDKNSIRVYCAECNLELGYPNVNQINLFLS
jgi:hypothetical protein